MKIEIDDRTVFEQISNSDMFDELNRRIGISLIRNYLLYYYSERDFATNEQLLQKVADELEVKIIISKK
ncbi:MAG: hypothetical protein LBP85_09955 [Prevotellaceae bacterium]|jgi:hypothetical protein|nr:hypothetical protein [Prevotellaceae bacterium]